MSKIIKPEDIVEATPWSVNLSEDIDPDKFKGDTQLNIIGAAYKGSEISNSLTDDLNGTIANLQSIIADIAAGDVDAMERPEFACLNWNAIRAAIKWLNESNRLSDTSKIDLATNAWRLNFKCKPPTPDEFLTEKYIGPMADSLYKPVKDAFCEFLDPMKPYRTGVLGMHIGWGKSLWAVLTNLFLSTHFAMMWHPYKFFGQSVSTVYVQTLGGWNLKKASELLLEPFMNILENAPYFQKIRTHGEIIEKQNDDEIADHIFWTSASKTACLQMQNGVNYKIVNGPGAILGQSQPLDSKIYLSDGSYKQMGDIKVGDKIASPTEGEQTVLGVYPKGKKKTFKVILTDGRIVKCSPDHLWKISYKKNKLGKRIWEVKPLQFIIDHPDLDIEIWDNDCNDDLPYIWKYSNKGLSSKILKIEQIEDSEQQCIYVSSKDHLYITDDKICTHNTIIAGTISELTMFEENGWTQDQILTFFTKLRKRIDSRMKGNYYGRFLLDSQPNSMESCIDKWIWQDAPKDPKNYILTGSRWRYYPEDFPEAWDENHNIKRDFINGFPLYKGGSGNPAQVIESPSQLEQFDQHDIIWCPVKQITNNGTVNFWDAARENPIEFLRDWCGIPSSSADRIFYDPKVVEDVFDNTLKNVYGGLDIPATEEPEHLIWDKIKGTMFNKIIDKYYFYYEPNLPRVASIDLAISGDVASISVSHVERSKDLKDSQGNPAKVYVTDFSIPVVPKNSIINLDAFKFFLLDLRRLGNMNIRYVSFDGFQSRSIMQSLERNGFNVQLLSVDKQNEPYQALIDYAFHRRWKCGKSIMAKNNLLSLEVATRKTGTKKIDHKHGENCYADEFTPLNGVYTEQSWKMSQVGYYAKDLTDGIAANIALLDEHDNEFLPITVWDPAAAKERNYESVKEDVAITRDFLGFSL